MLIVSAREIDVNKKSGTCGNLRETGAQGSAVKKNHNTIIIP